MASLYARIVTCTLTLVYAMYTRRTTAVQAYAHAEDMRSSRSVHAYRQGGTLGCTPCMGWARPPHCAGVPHSHTSHTWCGKGIGAPPFVKGGCHPAGSASSRAQAPRGACYAMRRRAHAAACHAMPRARKPQRKPHRARCTPPRHSPATPDHPHLRCTA